MRIGLGPMSPVAEAVGSEGWAPEATVDAAMLAEASGFDSVWFLDTDFGGSRSQAATALAGAAAARTRAVRLGVCPIVTRGHPLHAAEDVAVLDVISNGRVIACPGSPSSPPGDAAGRFPEAVEILLHAWSGDAFSYDGRFYRVPARLPSNAGAAQVTKVAVTPLPAQTAVPVWLPGWIAEARPLAARLGVPLLGSPFASLPELVACYEPLRRPARERGIPLTVPVVREVCLAPTAAAAWALAESVLSRPYARYAERGLVSAPAGYFKSLAADRFIVGDPLQCLAEIERYRAAIGLNYLICRFSVAAAASARIAEVVDLFARTLVPHLRMVNPDVPAGS